MRSTIILENRVVTPVFSGRGGVVLSENNNIQKSEFLSDEINSAGDHSARGIRQIIQRRNKEVLTEINKIKEKYAKGEFGSLETKDGREKAQAAYDRSASEIRKSENLKKPVVIIKSTPGHLSVALWKFLTRCRSTQFPNIRLIT